MEGEVKSGGHRAIGIVGTRRGRRVLDEIQTNPVDSEAEDIDRRSGPADVMLSRVRVLKVKALAR